MGLLIWSLERRAQEESWSRQDSLVQIGPQQSQWVRQTMRLLLVGWWHRLS